MFKIYIFLITLFLILQCVLQFTDYWSTHYAYFDCLLIEIFLLTRQYEISFEWISYKIDVYEINFFQNLLTKIEDYNIKIFITHFYLFDNGIWYNFLNKKIYKYKLSKYKFKD